MSEEDTADSAPVLSDAEIDIELDAMLVGAGYPPSVGVARLENGIYMGLDIVAAADAPAGAVLVPVDCDLAAGRYTWNAIDERFEPIPPKVGGISATLDVQATQVLALVVDTLARGNTPLDARIVAWFNAYRVTVDAPAGLAVIQQQ